MDCIIEGCASTLSVQEFIARLEDAGIAYARLSTVRELSRHPALHRQTVGFQSGSFSSVALPIARPGQLPVRLPAIGEHIEAVREEFSTALATDRPAKPL
jgi:crotonobetainyl-CoA:carnitine CoA-transferase CaiB-like acyl-CoA transferase